MYQIFLSSVQKELAEEREAVASYVRNDPLLRKHFSVYLFEEGPSCDRSAGEVYLKAVDDSSVYMGIFGDEYGPEGDSGKSATELEFDRATDNGIARLIYIKGRSDDRRNPRMLDLIKRAQKDLIRRRFDGAAELIEQVYASLIEYLEERGVISSLPLDAAAHPDAELGEVADEKVRAFLKRAKSQRNYALDPDTPLESALAHLDMLDRGRPANAALLLFGSDPQHRFPSAETKCLQYHGTVIRKPIPDYRIFKGDLFEQVDQAVDFVLSKLRLAIGTRSEGPQADRTYEIPPAVVQEAIVNAIAHRDYASLASVQVHVFTDRVEILNPGALPGKLTVEDLRKAHTSHPRYPLIADALFWAHYIEKAGTGTLDMISGCRDAGLPEPDFREDGQHFVLTLWRNWLTPEVLRDLGLSDRQMKAVDLIRAQGQIGNTEYQEALGVSKRTAHRDLADLVEKGVLERFGTTGKGTSYSIRKGVI